MFSNTTFLHELERDTESTFSLQRKSSLFYGGGDDIRRYMLKISQNISNATQSDSKALIFLANALYERISFPFAVLGRRIHLAFTPESRTK